MTYFSYLEIKLVLLSIVVAIFASFASVKMIHRISMANEAKKNWWVAAGSVTLALGIWTMHFIGMLGLQSDVEATFSLTFTLLSLFITWLGTLAIFMAVRQSNPTFLYRVSGITFLALSIMGMHFLGMKSMEMGGRMQINFPLLLIAFFMAFSVSIETLLFFEFFKKKKSRNLIMKLLGAVFIGIGISAVHYTATEAALFNGLDLSKETDKLMKISDLSISTDILAYLVGVATISIIIIIYSLTYADKRRAETKQQRQAKEFNHQINKARQDLQNIVQLQQGMTFKYIKMGDRFIHTFCEGGLLRKMGISSDQVTGKELTDFLPINQAEEKLAFYQKAWCGEIISYVGHLNDVDYYVTLSPVIEDGSVSAVIGSAVDLSEKKTLEKIQKEIEMKLRESNALRKTMINHLPIGILVVDNEMKITAINRQQCRMFHPEEPMHSIIGQSIGRYRPNFYRDLQKEEAAVREIIANRKPYVDEIELKNDSIMKRSYFPFSIGKGQKGHLWTFEDITERKRMEDCNRKAREEAEKANLAKSQFMSKMSHELRTPLNGILGFSQLLEIDDSLSSKQKEFVGQIRKGGRHLLNLINDILDLSRIEAGNLKISTDSVKIGTILHECMILVGPPADEKGIRIFEDRNQDAERFVKADPLRLRQIFLNLLDNAIKYNVENGKVYISYESKQDFLYVHIRDTGIGIPENEQVGIFKPFYRLNDTWTEGTGIGLTLVKQLVSLMGGLVGVDSSKGGGSHFWIGLPLTAENNFHHNQCGRTAIASRVLPTKREYKILYIEDNPANLQLVSEIIGAVPGFALLSAATGNQGLEIVQKQSIDLILCDIHLPDINGLKVLTLLKSNASTGRLPVIAVSANAMEADINRALEMGFSDYITKPIDILQFIRTISNHL